MITIPKLIDLCNDLKSDIEAAFNITIPSIGKNFFRNFSNSYGAKLKLFYLATGNVQKQVLPDTAESEDIGGTLERHGRVKLGRNPFAPTAGVYTITVTGDIGAIIPATTTFKSNDDSSNPGFLFRVDNAYTLVATTDTVNVRALTAGEEGELILLDKLTATAPISNVSSAAYISAIVTPPQAAETEKDYRKKILLAYRLEPTGGSVDDYRLWAQDAQGVAVIYPYNKSGYPNELQIYVEATIADSVDGKGTPSAQLLEDVEEVVEMNPDTTLARRTRRPMGILNIDFLPVTIREIDIDIPNFIGVTAPQQALIDSALEDMLAAMRPFVAGGDILAEKNDILDANKIVAVIVTAVPGASFSAPTFTVDGVPFSTYTFIAGNIPHKNGVTYS